MIKDTRKNMDSFGGICGICLIQINVIYFKKCRTLFKLSYTFMECLKHFKKI